MLPKIDDDLSEDYEVEEQPSLAWKLDLSNGRIRGTVDGREGIRQAIYCILCTERYESLIHSWDYGVELMDLYGTSPGYALPELERRIKEALMQDDRIYAVEGFSFEWKKKGAVALSFTAVTEYVGITAEK